MLWKALVGNVKDILHSRLDYILTKKIFVSGILMEEVTANLLSTVIQIVSASTNDGPLGRASSSACLRTRRRILTLCVAMSVGFLICWTPYNVIALG